MLREAWSVEGEGESVLMAAGTCGQEVVVVEAECVGGICVFIIVPASLLLLLAGAYESLVGRACFIVAISAVQVVTSAELLGIEARRVSVYKENTSGPPKFFGLLK